MTSTQDDQRIIHAEVEDTRRLGTTRNGNPSYRFTLTDGRQYTTKPNAQVGYALTGKERGPANLTVENGRVVGVDWIGRSEV